MQYRQLGSAGLRVSSLALGTMTFGGRGQFRDVGQTDLEGARRQIDVALEAGVNLIDTADVYSGGAAESILGRALNGRRDQVVLASKRGFRWEADQTMPVSRGTISSRPAKPVCAG